jgi:hypothetical protein
MRMLLRVCEASGTSSLQMWYLSLPEAARTSKPCGDEAEFKLGRNFKRRILALSRQWKTVIGVQINDKNYKYSC